MGAHQAEQLQNDAIVHATAITTTYFPLFGFLKAVIAPFIFNPQLSLVT